MSKQGLKGHRVTQNCAPTPRRSSREGPKLPLPESVDAKRHHYLFAWVRAFSAREHRCVGRACRSACLLWRVDAGDVPTSGHWRANVRYLFALWAGEATRHEDALCRRQGNARSRNGEPLCHVKTNWKRLREV